MAITQTITAAPSPAPSKSQAQATFDAAMAAFIAAWASNITEVNTWATQANALAASLNNLASGAAASIPYTFSTTTTDADPGAGYLRLDNATQNLATTIRADLAGSDGTTWTDLLNTFAASTSTVKGHIMLQKSGDASKWIIFTVSALASPAGYRNITVAVVAASAASPFADGDSILLKFTRTGDKGETGETGATGPAGASGAAGDHAVVVHTGNGRGSTNAVIRRFSTVLTNVGTAITYADSSTDGATFTINETGIYAITYRDSASGSPLYYGASLNSNQLNTGIQAIAIANVISLGYVPTNNYVDVTRVVKLTAGDVVRAHTTTNADSTSSASCMFSIRKVNNV